MDLLFYSRDVTENCPVGVARTWTLTGPHEVAVKAEEAPGQLIRQLNDLLSCAIVLKICQNCLQTDFDSD